MLYLTGEHALNLECNLLTCGDWHTSALRWKNLNMQDTDKSIFGKYGLEYDRTIPDNEGVYVVANHIRALLDLLDQGKFSIAQGMREDFICNEEYTEEVFSLVIKLETKQNWAMIDDFMAKEYKTDWIKYIKCIRG